jgi:hypothetical protein
VRSIAVIVASTLGWPGVEIVVFWLRFRHLPPGGLPESWVFVPMGFVAGLVAVILASRASSQLQRRLVFRGYLAASPFAFVGALLGGLVLPGLWGPLVFGAVPLALGCVIGFVAGRSPAAGTA